MGNTFTQNIDIESEIIGDKPEKDEGLIIHLKKSSSISYMKLIDNCKAFPKYSDLFNNKSK